MSDLSDLYQQAVLDHNNRPRNFGPLEKRKRLGARVQPAVRGHNKRGGRAGWGDYQGGRVSGDGCAISKASASMMTELVKGLNKEEARELFELFHESVTGETGMDMMEAIDRLGKLAALTGVSQFPMRVKCASLAWHTLKAALVGEGEKVTTE